MLVAVDPEIEVIGEVGDGQAAVDAALSARPDVVVMDLRMPRMDGVEATRRIADALEEGVELVVGGGGLGFGAEEFEQQSDGAEFVGNEREGLAYLKFCISLLKTAVP